MPETSGVDKRTSSGPEDHRRAFRFGAAFGASMMEHVLDALCKIGAFGPSLPDSEAGADPRGRTLPRGGAELTLREQLESLRRGEEAAVVSLGLANEALLEVERELENWREKFRTYAEHKASCASRIERHPEIVTPSLPCDCGLDALISAAVLGRKVPT